MHLMRATQPYAGLPSVVISILSSDSFLQRHVTSIKCILCIVTVKTTCGVHEHKLGRSLQYTLSLFHLCLTVIHVIMSPEVPTNTPMMPIVTPIMRGVLLLSHSELRVLTIVEI